jgi:D-alanyl-D-alanine carboxypeptidase (penicillin-binding protein 5/6)
MLRKLRYIVCLSIIVIVFAGMWTSVFSEFETPAKCAVLMEFSTGTFLYEKEADLPVSPASITKLMTLYLGFEAVKEGRAKWDDMVYVSEKAWRTEGSRMWLEERSKVSYRDIITGISVVSANDACVALAEHLYGSVSGFVQVMNEKAREMGLTNTQFRNPHGLTEEGHHMSARDIAVLAKKLIEDFPEILELESMRSFTHNGITEYNRNPLLGVFPGADGLKTGWTEDAGYCLVGTAKQDGIRLISVILNTKDETERKEASQDILAYGFRNFELFTAVRQGDIVTNMEVEKGIELSVPVKAVEDITIVIPSARKNDIKITPVLNQGSLKAPVEPDTVVGKLEVKLDDKVLATTDISTAGSVEKAGFFRLLVRFILNLFR